MRMRLLAAVMACAILASCSEKKEPATSSKQVIADTLARSAITFILGTDENPRNPYYSLANQYYRLNDSEKTEIVIDTIYSLSGVLEYLANYRPLNGRPWGLINLVSHGNEFVDLSVPVQPHGRRVSEASLAQAIGDSTLRPLDTSIADRLTLVNLHGCAVGKNTGLLKMLGVAFGGSTPLQVKASKLFEYYGNASPNNNPMFVRHYYAKAWYAFYRPDSVPSNDALAEQFKLRYPGDTVKWDTAIGEYYPDNPSQAYNIRLVIPVVWEDFYQTKQELPDLRSAPRQAEWLQQKPEFETLMKRSGIPREYFAIKFYSATYDGDSGKYYAIRVKARAGLACIIKPLIQSGVSSASGYAPYIPSDRDTAAFGYAFR
jgi:hypothetical protein